MSPLKRLSIQSSIVGQTDDQQALDKQIVHKATAAASPQLSNPKKPTCSSSLTGSLSLVVLPLACLRASLYSDTKARSNLRPGGGVHGNTCAKTIAFVIHNNETVKCEVHGLTVTHSHDKLIF